MALRFEYSGGSGNDMAALSLGGSRSGVVVPSDVINSLFRDISPDESESGLGDYSCVYVCNNSGESAPGVELYLTDVSGGATVALGVGLQDEVQRVKFSVFPTGGSGTFTYAGLGDFEIAGGLGDAGTGEALVLGLEGLGILGVTASSDTGGGYTLRFRRASGGRPHPLLTCVASYSSGETVEVTRVQGGGPIGVVAEELGLGEVPSVTFGQPRMNSPLFIGSLGDGEWFPVWLRRSVVAGTGGMKNDGVELWARHRPADYEIE